MNSSSTREDLEALDEDKSNNEKALTSIYTAWFFSGRLGGHRYYLGNYIYAIFMTLTFGGFGVWTTIDVFFIKKQIKKKQVPLQNQFIHPRWYKIADSLTFFSLILYSLLPIIVCFIYVVLIYELYKSFGMPTWKDIQLYILVIIISFKIVQLPMYLFLLSLHSTTMRKFPFISVCIHMTVSVLLVKFSAEIWDEWTLFRSAIYFISGIIFLTGLYRFILYLIVARKKEIDKELKKHRY